MQPRVTVNYSTVDAPGTFITLTDLNYSGASGTAAWVHLTDLGLATTSVAKVQFVFQNQQNGYVGYNELAVQGTAIVPSITGDVWSGSGTGGNLWSTNAASTNWSGAHYTEGDAVNFNDKTVQNTAVTTGNVVIQAGGVNPSKVTFGNTTVPYTITNTAGDTMEFPAVDRL